jgi:predicted dehydrogenase
VNEPVRVGIIGCGTISAAYFKGLKPYNIVDVVACADLVPNRAAEKALEFEVPKACTVDELLADPNIDLVVNLTIPKAHFEVNAAAIAEGKSTLCEKPLAVTREDGIRTVELARERGVRVGCAPDTFLGGGIQTCRKLIDDGWIGEPVAATAFMVGHGHESWHPAPDFYYQAGGGPMFDMGPYYITALVNLLGPVKRVSGSTKSTFSERTITREGDRYGERIPVETTTHLAGTLDFASGAIATMIMSFDVWAHHLPRIEIYGSEGSLSVPDPNRFDGPVRVRRAGSDTWSEVPLTHSPNVSRGIGTADLAYGLVYGRAHRVNGDLACHVLDVMASFDDSSTTGSHVTMQTTCERPAPLPLGLLPGQLDKE